MQSLAPGSDEIADRQEARKWEELSLCRLCGRKPQLLTLEHSVKIACPTGCKIIESPTLADATYVWNERWYAHR